MRTCFAGIICLVVVAISGIAFAQQSFYSLHVSSHRQQAKADMDVNKLKAQGLDAFVRHEKVAGKGMWYRVYVGKYATRKEANADIKRLKQQNVSKYFAVRNISGTESMTGAAAAATAAQKAPAASTYRPPAAKVTDYYLFVGFYRDLDTAQKEFNRLKTALAPYGYRIYLTRKSVSDGTIYRVYIGTFADQQLAATAGAELKNKQLLSSFYIPVQTPQDMIDGLMSSTAASAAKAAPAAAAAAAAAAAPKKTPAEPQKKVTKEKAEKPAPAKKAWVDDFDDFSRFSVKFKGGVFYPKNIDKFIVTDGATTYRISDDPTAQAGIEALVRFTEVFGLYVGADGVFISGVDWYNISAGPMLTFQAGDSVMPYLKGGAVYTDLSWDAPGKFDASVGWEVGTGIDFMRSNLKIGVELMYRDGSLDYKPTPTASANETSLDLSGFSAMASLSYWF